MTWTAQILTLFPDMFPGALGHSLAGRALNDRLWTMNTFDIRDFSADKHRSVDDTPAGGGPGMVMRADVLARAVDSAREKAQYSWPLICLSPRGEAFGQSIAQEFAEAGGMTLVCGRFEGIDQRIIDGRNMREISIGDYVLSGGYNICTDDPNPTCVNAPDGVCRQPQVSAL